MKRSAFTLIELLVVIAIIAILAAILFPVFAQAKAAAKKTTCLSNTKNIATAFMLYGGDADDLVPMYQKVDVCPWPEVCGTNNVTLGYLFMLQPYTKSNLLSQCPETKQLSRTPVNSTSNRLFREGRMGYGMAYPLGEPGGGSNPQYLSLGQFGEPANRLLVLDSVPDGTSSRPLFDSAGIHQNYALTPFNYSAYGFSYVRNPAFSARPEARHNGVLNATYLDGHAKNLRFEQVYPVQESVCRTQNNTGCRSLQVAPATAPEMWRLWSITGPLQ